MKLARHIFGTAVISLLIFALPAAANASAALFMEEPFGTFGYVNPTGHAAVYLSNVCAASPIRLRRCEPGEAGVVISRYHRVAGYDWLAIPLIPYLYAVDSITEIPENVTPEQEAQLRDAYRREHLEQLVPDSPDHQIPGGEWIQLIGASYDRRIYVFEVDTTDLRDDAFIAAFNDRRNVSHFNLFFNNCADFSRKVLDFYYPHSVHRNIIADTGMTTPKELARSLTQYAHRHENIDLRTYLLPQVSGTVPRSQHIDGVVESFLKKKYVLPLAVFQPAIAGGLAVAYLCRGRYTPGQDAETLEIGTGLQHLYTDDTRLPHGSVLDSQLGFPQSATHAPAADGTLLEDAPAGGLYGIDSGAQ